MAVVQHSGCKMLLKPIEEEVEELPEYKTAKGNVLSCESHENANIVEVVHPDCIQATHLYRSLCTV